VRWGDRETEEEVYDEFSDQHQRHVSNYHIPQRFPSHERKKDSECKVAKSFGRVTKTIGNKKATDSSLKRFVTFYITNFPPQASNFFL